MIRETWPVTLSILAGLGFIIGCWDKLGFGAVAIVLGVLLLGIGRWAYRKRTLGVPFVAEGDDVLNEATRMLRATKRSLYYFGGVGFIGGSPRWKEVYEEKLQNDRIKIVRFLNAKSARVMKTMLKEVFSEDLAERDTGEYVEWLATHAENLDHREKNNFFYDFEGAPIWKYGIHCMVFDRKHIAIPFLSSAATRSAVFIQDCPDMATAVADSLDFLKDSFDEKGSQQVRRRKFGEDLRELAKLV